MFGAESHLGNQFSIKPAPMPGLQTPSIPSNPFQGIRRAGQAKRAQNFEKYQNSKSGPQNYGQSSGSFSGAKNQSLGGQAGTLAGSMRQGPQEKFS